MGNLQGKTIVVIGANGAFGSELCVQLKASGAKVIGTARNPESSVRLAADLEQRLILDLTGSSSIENFATYLNSSAPQIDGLIFAAGLVAFGSITDTPAQVVQTMMQVNAQGQIDLASRLVPKLELSAAAGHSPFILSISGVISESPMAKLAAYSASKTAIHGYSVAAGRELQKLGIRWLDARPGHTESGLASRAIFGVAPNFGLGASVQAVVARMILGVTQAEADLPSSSFK
jgi:cyclic-di-GMP-binding biofilm dispersal mediator protein